jgi:hypothetical protein
MPELMDKGGNPDAAQDESLIMSVIQRELGPVIEALGSRLSEQGDTLEEVKDLLFKFTQGLIGAADNHKRTSLGEELTGKYGKDMEPFEELHKSFHGKGFSDSLLDELMGEGAPGDDERDGWVQNKLKDAKGKWGKYVGLEAEVPEGPESAEVPEQEAVAGEEDDVKGEGEEKEGEKEEKLGEKLEKEGEVAQGEKEEEKGEKEEEAGEKEEEAGENEEEDAISKLMKEMTSLTGARHKLSEPISPKKSKAPIRR